MTEPREPAARSRTAGIILSFVMIATGAAIGLGVNAWAAYVQAKGDSFLR